MTELLKILNKIDGNPRWKYVEATKYTTQPGESVMGIAMRQLGDRTRWVEILELNARFEDLGPHEYFPVNTEINLPSKKS